MGFYVINYIKQTLKIDFVSCKIVNSGKEKIFEFTLPDQTKKTLFSKEVLFILNDRHSKIQFDMVSLCKNLLHPITH